MKVKAKKVEKTVVNVSLTEREAVALAALVGSFGGWASGKDNPRAVIGDALWNALDEAGYGDEHTDYDKFSRHIVETGTIGD